MRKTLPILSLHLKSFFKTPSVLVLMFVLPLLFSFIFGGISVNSAKNKPVVNIVSSQDDFSAQITNLFKKNQHYSWKTVTLKKARKNVKNEKAIAAIVIPNNIEERITEQQVLFDVIIQKKTEDYLALTPFLEGTARLVSSTYKIVGKGTFSNALTAVAQQKGVAIEKQIVQKNINNHVEINLMVVGFAMMFMMFGLSGAASSILDEKKEGTWERLLISPARKYEIIFGYLVAYFLMGWIQFAVLLTAMKVMFHTSWENLDYLVPFTSLVIISVVGFGLMIAGLVKTKQQAIALSSILIVSTCMLGGVYWSLDLVPIYMQKIAIGVPQSWAMSGFKEIMSGSLNSGILLKDTFALTGFSVLFFVVGLRGIRGQR